METHELSPMDSAREHSLPSDGREQTIHSSPPRLSKRQTTIVFLSVACSTLLSAIVNGMFTVEIPTIAEDVHLSQRLLLWPQSIVSLISACTLLLAGSLSDVLGSRPIYLLGSFLQTVFIIGTGLARTATQLLTFRGLMGLTQSMCLTSSVSITVNSFPAGRRRNLAFACMGGGQPLGFSVGLVLGGVLTQTIGWRFGLYLVAGINFAVFVAASLGIKESNRPSSRGIWVRLKRDIDWIGTFLATTCLALLCYVLASVTGNTASIKSPSKISILCIAVLLAPMFVLWMRYQVRSGQPALVPNSVWLNRIFASVCIGVFFTWGSFNTLEQLMSLWLQIVQRQSQLQTSIRFLPQTVVGVIVNAAVGLSIHRFSVFWVLITSCSISLSAPILMGLSGTRWIYWAAAFPAISLNVVGADCFYTIANLLISSQFPENEKGLAGGVFNTVAQVGKSLGLALSAVITDAIADSSKSNEEGDRIAEGYRGGFWFCLAFNVMTFFVIWWGLRKCGKIDKEE